jgi:outer membrane protein assembly factor BamB
MNKILFTMLVVALLLLVSVPAVAMGVEAPHVAAGEASRQIDRGLASSPYPVYGLDLQHTNRSACTGPTTTPEIEWTATTTGSGAEMPLSIGSDGTLYLGLRNGDEGLHAYNPDGSLKWWWSRPVEQGVSGTAAVIEDYVYINFGTHWPPDDYGMAKLNQTDGSEVWMVSSNDSAYMSSPAVDSSGNVYFGSYDCYLRSVADDGSLNWAYSAGSYPDGIIFCSPAIGDDGTIYVGDDGHGAIALNSDGSVKWTTALPDRPIYGPNILGNGNIVYCSQDGTITALNDSGVSQWTRFFSGSYATGAVAADGTTLYVKTGSYSDQKLTALDVDGNTVWEYSLGTAGNDAPVVGADGTIYVSQGASVSAINPDGTELWTLSLDLGEAGHYYSTSWPVIGGDGILYVLLNDSMDFDYSVSIVRLYAETESVTVTVDAPDSEVAEDSDFTVDVNISDVTDFDACNYDVTFDPLVLQLDDVTTGLIGSTATPVDLYNELSLGTYRIIQNVPGLTGATGSGYLAVLHFHVVGSGGDSSAITLSDGMLSDTQAEEITAIWVGDTVTVTSVIPGDANGDGAVNALDITKVERIIAGLDAETPGADANGDGNVNALDITKVERIIAGLD